MSALMALCTADDFNLPKLHSLLHYVPAIKELGTTDNYNTETTERLHIDYAKEAYRAGNGKDHINQMVIWMTRMERIDQHIMHVRWREAQAASHPPKAAPIGARLQLTKNPSVHNVSLASLSSSYHAPAFASCLQSYLQQRFAPHRSSPLYPKFAATLSSLATIHTSFPVWHRLRIINASTQHVDGIADRRDAIHASPARKSKLPNVALYERFDTALIDEKGEAEDTGIQGMFVLRPLAR